MDDMVHVCGGKEGSAVRRLVKAKPWVQRGPFKSWPVAGYLGSAKRGQQPFLRARLPKGCGKCRSPSSKVKGSWTGKAA